MNDRNQGRPRWSQHNPTHELLQENPAFGHIHCAMRQTSSTNLAAIVGSIRSAVCAGAGSLIFRRSLSNLPLLLRASSGSCG